MKEFNYPPTVRDICAAFGLKSSSTAHFYLKTLEKKGYIRRNPQKPRAIELLSPQVREEKAQEKKEDIFYVPVVGEVTAGKPVLAEENIAEYYPLPRELFPGSANSFILHLKGDSMKNAGILDGDYILVKQQNYAQNGDIVVALLENDATVKRFFKEDGKIKLKPENEEYKTVVSEQVTILGKVMGLIRKMQ